MKRFHVHVRVPEIAPAIEFYSTLFGVEPVRREADYAKWMLEDPRVNFAISTRDPAARVGLSHLGLQTETADELAAVATRASAAGAGVRIETSAACCYAKSDKAWVTDPAGIPWETFLTHGDLTTYGEQAAAPTTELATAPVARTTCCAA